MLGEEDGVPDIRLKCTLWPLLVIVGVGGGSKLGKAGSGFWAFGSAAAVDEY